MFYVLDANTEALTLPPQVPAAATLPSPPSRPDQAPDELLHPLAPLPVLRQPNGAETVQGAFFEAGHTSDTSIAHSLVIPAFQVCSLIQHGVGRRCGVCTSLST